LFQHAANFSGKKVKALNPVYDPAEVAEHIVELAVNPKREIIVGRAATVISTSHSIAPAASERLFAEQVKRDHFEDKPSNPTRGNLFHPQGPLGQGYGGWRK